MRYVIGGVIVDKKLRMLLADTNEALELIEELLGDEYEIVLCGTLQEAKHALVSSTTPENIFDVVVTGINFDNSSMITLLEFIRSVDHLERLPFLPIRTMAGNLHVGDSLVSSAVKALGGRPLVLLFGPEKHETVVALKLALDGALSNPVATSRYDRGDSPHLAPEQFHD